MRAIVITRTVPASPAALYNTILSPGSWEHWLAVHRESSVNRPAG